MIRTNGLEAARFTASVMVASLKRSLVMVGLGLAIVGETRVSRDGKWKRRGRPDVDGPGPSWVVGTDKPDATNTGPRVAPEQTFGSSGTAYVYTISVPGIYDAFVVWGRIQVNIQTGVTIMDVTVNMTQPPPTSSVYGILFNHADSYDNFVQFCHITVPNSGERTEWVSAGIRGRGYEAYRCNIEYTVDGCHAVGKAGYTVLRDVGIISCYLHNFIARSSVAQGTTHDDGVQCFSGVNLDILGCNIEGGTTSCIILNYAVSFPYGVVNIIENWLYGDPDAGATINISTSGETIPTLNVWKNRVDINGHDNGQISVQVPNLIPASFGATSGTPNPPGSGVSATADWVYGSNKNVYMDGSTCPTQRG